MGEAVLRRKSRSTTKLAVFLFALVLSLSFVAAVGDQLHADRATNNDPDFSDVQIQEKPLFSFLLSFLSTNQRTVEPGGEIGLEWEVDADWETGAAPSRGDAQYIVEIYDCKDRGCDSGSNDQFVEAMRFPVATYVYNGQAYTASATYSVHDSAEGWWAATAYLWHSEFTSDNTDNDDDGVVDETDEALISDTPVERFEVSTADNSGSDTGDSDTGSDSGDSSDSSEADVVAANPPSVSVENGRVTGTVTFENSGDSNMPSSNIVEMQVRPQGSGPLSFASGPFSFVSDSVQTCDSSHPENVHKEFRLDAGDSTSISLSTSAVEPGQQYDVYFMTRTGCSGDRANPYTHSESVRGICVGDCSGSTGPSPEGNQNLVLYGLILGLGLILAGWRLRG
jgi:hypothetical protein